MCDFDVDHEALAPLESDEYRLDTPRVQEFVAAVRGHIATAGSPEEACGLIGPGFAELLADRDTLLPPREDVHRVRTTSAQTSVSIHLLANDTGCVWRHTYDEQTGQVRPFRSGYVNAECESDLS